MSRARLYDPAFKYTPAASTDIAKTFARIRRQQREEQAATKAQPSTVTPLKKVAK